MKLTVPPTFLDLLDRCVNWFPKTTREVKEIEVSDVLGVTHGGSNREIAVVRDRLEGGLWALPLGAPGAPTYDELRRGVRLQLTLKRIATASAEVVRKLPAAAEPPVPEPSVPVREPAPEAAREVMPEAA